MPVQQENKKAFAAVVEMAEMLALSKSRFHALIQAGVFPKPARHEPCKHPVFDLELQQKCLEIRQTGIAHNGAPVLFNRMRANRKPRQQRQQQGPNETRPDEHRDLVEALKSLGLTATSDPEDNRTNHPHRAGRGMICHNGVVANHASLVRRYHLTPETDCDTEVLGLLIAHHFSGPLVQRAARAAEVTDGKLAVLGIWRKPARLLIVRRGNPLCMGETKDGFYFGSLPGALSGRVRSLPDYEASVIGLADGRLSATSRSSLD